MTLTVFLAICILGCDLLVFFLFQWTLGERRRTRRRRRSAKMRLSSGLETGLYFVPARGDLSSSQACVVHPAKRARKPHPLLASLTSVSVSAELSAHRRKAAAYVLGVSSSRPSTERRFQASSR
jgi:hypothetical protein